MTSRLFKITTLAVLAAPPFLMASPVELARESFEGAGGAIGFTTSVSEFDEPVNSLTGDFFGVIPNNGTKLSGGTLTGGDGASMFAAEDLDTSPALLSPTQSVTLNQVTITGKTSTSVKILLAAPGTGPAAAGSQNFYDHSSTAADIDFIRVEASIDNGPFNPLLQFSPTNPAPALNSPLSLDTDFNGLGGQGTTLTAAFQEFDVSIPTGNTVQVRVVMHSNASNEYLCVDNIRVLGDSPATSPPALAGVSGSPLVFTEGGSAAALASSLTVTDSDSPTLPSASVVITQNLTSGEDVLAATPSGSILAGDIVYTAATGTLAINRVASLADYQAVLRSVTYRNTNGSNPNTGTRQIRFSTTDGVNPSNTPIREVQIVDNISTQTLPFTESFETDGRGTRYALTGRFTNGNAMFDRGQPAATNLDGSFGIVAEDTVLDAAPVKAVDFLCNTAGRVGVTATVRLGALGGAIFDTGDTIAIEASVNGGAYSTITAFRSTSSVNGSLALDTNNDGTGDGTALGAALQDFIVNMPTANTLGLRIRCQSNSTSERLVVDRVLVEGSLLEFSIGDASGSESGTQTFTVTRSSTSGADTIDFATSNDTATAGSDFTTNSGTLNFSDGQATRSITITVSPDSTVELNETYAVTLTNPSRGAITDAAGTGTIINDDSSVISISGGNSVAEGDSGTASLPFTVSLTNPVDVDVSVNRATPATGTATAGTDFTALSGSLTIPAGATIATLNVVVAGDNDFEADETVDAAISGLSAGGRAVTLGTANATGTITDDDPVPTATIAVADTAFRVGETTTVTITFNQAVTGFNNSDLTIPNGTLDSVITSDGGITWTAMFTPNASVEDADNVITLDNTGVTGTSGSPGIGTTESNSFAIDTLAPVNTVPAAQTTTRLQPLVFNSGNGNVISVSDGSTLSTVVSVSDGTLQASTGGGASITANNTASVTINGTNTQINAALNGLIHTPNALGVRTITVQSTDAVGNTDTDTIAVTVNNATLLVTTNLDSSVDQTIGASFAADQSDGGGLSVREALNWARGGDTITFDLDSATAGNQGGTITLGGTQLAISYGVTIDGDLDDNGTADVTISGNNFSRVFQVNGGVTGVTLSGLVITEGRTYGGGLYINPGANVTLRDSVVSNNQALNFGGGIYNQDGILSVIGCTISGNSALSDGLDAGYGGGIFSFGQSRLSVVSSSITGNSSDDVGGGIYCQTNSPGTFILVNSTISGNRSNLGGGLFLDGSTSTAQLSNNTIVGNAARNEGGGIWIEPNPSDSIDLKNTVVAGNAVNPTATAAVGGSALAPGIPSDAQGPIASATNCYFGTNATITTNNGSLVNQGTANLLLGNLANHNGSPRLTHQPLAGSALINAGSNAVLPVDAFDLDSDSDTAEPLPFDANGSTRTITTVDIGAVETRHIPKATSVSSDLANGSYNVGDTVTINVAFDDAVTVTGAPTLLLETGVTDQYATYSSGSGTATLTFSYTVQAGDASADLDYQSTIALALNGGTIRSSSAVDADLTLPTPGTANSLGGQKNLLIDGIAPVVASVSVPANGTYVAGQNLDFTVNFSEAITVDSSGGTPQIPVTLDTGGTVFAQYISGSGTSALVFRMTIASGQLDSNGISVGGSIAPNGGTMQDAAGNIAVTALNNVSSTAGVLVDAVPPTVTSVAVPANGIYNGGDVLGFTVNLSENVIVTGAPFIGLNVGGSTVQAAYVSGSGGASLLFEYTVQSGDNDADGIALPASIATNGGTLRDAAGNDLTSALNNIGSTAGVLIDTNSPGATAIVRADSNPTSAVSVSFTLMFSEAVSGVDTSDLTLATSGTAAGSIASVNPVDALTYTVVVNGISGTGMLSLNLNSSGTGIVDMAGNPLSGGLAGQTYVVDRDFPTVTSVGVPASATYQAGQNLDFTVSFSEPVTVGGTPRVEVAMETGGTAYANYLSGSGTNALVFRMTVVSGQADIDGVTLAAAIDLAGGTIRDALTNDAILTLNSVADTTGVRVDAVSPVVAGSGIPDQALSLGTAKVLSLPSFFTDIGSTSMTYTVTANTASGKASAAVSGGRLTLTPLVNGITDITVRADDGHGGTVSDTFEVAVGTAKPQTLQVGTTGKLNKQNGLFELTVKVTNTTARPINGFRLNVDYSDYELAYPGLRLHNAKGSKKKAKAHIDYPFPVASDEVISIKLRFYSRTRTLPPTFKPKLKVKELNADQVPGTKGKAVPVRRVPLANKNIMIEFPSVVGKWYRVRYSDDGIHWRNCLLPIKAGSTRTQWIDSGPPFTDVPPSQAPNRSYRVNEIIAR